MRQTSTRAAWGPETGEVSPPAESVNAAETLARDTQPQPFAGSCKKRTPTSWVSQSPGRNHTLQLGSLKGCLIGGNFTKVWAVYKEAPRDHVVPWS